MKNDGMPTNLTRTALYEEHLKAGGRMVDFGGWELPVQYKGIAEEHRACREKAALFDVSHMGEFLIEGKEALSFLEYALPNQVSRLTPGQALYSPLCHPSGGIVDDLLVYRLNQDRFFVVVNAANTAKDSIHFQKLLSSYSERASVQFRDVSLEYTQLALQGPNALEILAPLVDFDPASVPSFSFVENKILGKIPAILSRTGYTGEDGFEIYVPWLEGPALWQAILEEGKGKGLEPCGLGARDTLRLEAKLPLYGNDLNDETNPLEAGLGWTVKFAKGDFVGKRALEKVKLVGLKQKLVGMKLLERGIPRHGYPLFATADSTEPMSAVTSGTLSPTLGIPIALGYVPIAQSEVGSRIFMEIRGKKMEAQVIPTPFYKRNS